MTEVFAVGEAERCCRGRPHRSNQVPGADPALDAHVIVGRSLYLMPLRLIGK